MVVLLITPKPPVYHAEFEDGYSKRMIEETSQYFNHFALLISAKIALLMFYAFLKVTKRELVLSLLRPNRHL